MLLRNDLLQYALPCPRTTRILWIDRGRNIAYLYPIGAAGAIPELASFQALVADVQAGRALLLLVDPHAPNPAPAALPMKQLDLRSRAWAVVSALICDEPAIYQPRQRARMIGAYSAANGISHPTIYRYLRRYWERGQTPDALLPDYANSGAKGKTRGSNANVKRGRPRKDAAHPGLNADPDIRLTFRAAAARYAATHSEFSRRGAYRQMIEDYFGERSADALPTFGQFKYWIERDGPLAFP